MKKKSILSLIIAMFLSSNIAFAQQSDKVYLTADEVPNAVYWLLHVMLACIPASPFSTIWQPLKRSSRNSADKE